MALNRYSLEAGLRAGSGLTKAHAGLVALPEYLAVTKQDSNSVSPFHRGAAVLQRYISHSPSAKLDVVIASTPPRAIHQMVYEANVLVCHICLETSGIAYWLQKVPRGNTEDNSKDCLVAGKTRTEQGHRNSGLKEKMSLSPLPPLRRENKHLGNTGQLNMKWQHHQQQTHVHSLTPQTPCTPSSTWVWS